MSDMSRSLRLWIPVLVTAVGLGLGCSGSGRTGEDEQVTTRGQLEVTATLMEIKGELPDDPLYDYAFVFRYEVATVHRGDLPTEVIYVAQYKPLEPRAGVADARSGPIGGDLKRFRAGASHRMALVVPVDDHFMGGIVNRYFEESDDPIYWAVWTNRVDP